MISEKDCIRHSFSQRTVFSAVMVLSQMDGKGVDPSYSGVGDGHAFACYFWANRCLIEVIEEGRAQVPSFVLSSLRARNGMQLTTDNQ